MTTAVHLLIDYALNTLSATRIEIRRDECNGKSAAIAHRLGFVQEAR